MSGMAGNLLTGRRWLSLGVVGQRVIAALKTRVSAVQFRPWPPNALDPQLPGVAGNRSRPRFLLAENTFEVGPQLLHGWVHAHDLPSSRPPEAPRRDEDLERLCGAWS